MSDVPDEWAESAAGWDDDPYVRAYAAAAYESLIETGAELTGASVLDFGCGTGLLTERLAPSVESVLAVDSSAAMVEVLDRKLSSAGTNNVTTASSLDGQAGRFDLIVASSVLAFVGDLSATVTDLVGRLTPGGRFVHWDWEREGGDADHGLSRDEIQDALRAAGLDDVVVRQGFEVRLDDVVMAPLMGHGRAPLR